MSRIVALALSVILPWLSVTWAQSVREKMAWVSASNPMALCNDFTRAGFFIRRNNNSDNWVVFLESGGLCYNPTTCNRRFFVRKVRQLDGIRDDSVPEVVPYGQFDPSVAWTNTVYSGARSPAETVSPLMTSLQCLNINKTEGRDILDTDSLENPLFYGYNHVLIPYCSSDLWLGEESDTTDAISHGVSECDCFNFTTEANPNGCFTFNTTSSDLQFTFRGKIIYQSIIEQLLNDHGIVDADKVILAGSSAGGLGVINHAKWTRGVLSSNTEISVLFDSSWFIDFEGGLDLVFNLELYRRPSLNNTEHLFDILMSNEACNGMDWFGYPCCISAHCILTQRNNSGQLRYYPDNTPTFALFSLYDIYLLAPGLTTVDNLETVMDTTNSADSTDGVEVVFDFSAVVGEYGGIMNYTLDEATSQVSFLSYYVTQCFQHIYLATSTLWGDDGGRVLSADSPDLTRGITLYSNTISSGRWNTLLLAANDTNGGNRGTILEALTTWMALAGSGTIHFRDTCQGFICNAQCSGDLRVGELTSNNWHIGVKLFIAALVVGLAVACIALKITFISWLYRLEKRQDEYLDSIEGDEEEIGAHVYFPDCYEDEAVAVSCLDLHYSVKFDSRKAVKDERKDDTAPVILTDILDQDNRGDMQEDNIDRSLRITREPDERSSFSGRNTIEILKGVSIYFNPGEMTGVMGPSGCGKTTLLDILSDRRREGTIRGEIYINGIPIDEIRDWYVANTGYITQMAVSYYEELTVRENLTLAAQMKLPKTFTMRAKFERVEQALDVTGLLRVADTKVGGATGPGLSGGQKKRLVLALQVLKLPSIIFLDEPTAGLDATSSVEFLSHLNKLADSNRTIVLTIHQPRLEIFHMFHRLLLLSNGKISYHGIPERAYEVFVNALTTRCLEQHVVIPSLEDHNPADVIMDMLGNYKMRQIITENYEQSDEPRLVQNAIRRSRWKERTKTMRSTDAIRFMLKRPKVIEKHHGSNFTRIATLEARATKRVHFSVIFLTFIFFLYAFVLGTTYIQESASYLVIAGVCVFSTASALFMFPAMYRYYQPALKVYSFEKADRIGHAYDIVIQGFVRFHSISFFPVVFSATVLYLLLVNAESYNFLIYLQVVLTNIALNQTWIALLIAMICVIPAKAFRVSPFIVAVAGFLSGFFVPVGVLHWGYRWMVYFNPNYFGLSSIAFFILSEFDTQCEGNQLECYATSGPYVLSQFFFNINPYLHILVLFIFTAFYLLLAIFANWLKHTSIFFRLKRVYLHYRTRDALTREFDTHHDEYERSLDEDYGTEYYDVGALSPISEEESEEEESSQEAPKTTVTIEIEENNPKLLFRKAAWRIIANMKEQKDSSSSSHIADVVLQYVAKINAEAGTDMLSSWRKVQIQQAQVVDQSRQSSDTTSSLRSRQKALLDRIRATQALLKEETDQLLNETDNEEHKPRLAFRKAVWHIMANLKMQKVNSGCCTLADVVMCVLAMKRVGTGTDILASWGNIGSSASLVQPQDTHHIAFATTKPGSIPLSHWRALVCDTKAESIDVQSLDTRAHTLKEDKAVNTEEKIMYKKKFKEAVLRVMALLNERKLERSSKGYRLWSDLSLRKDDHQVLTESKPHKFTNVKETGASIASGGKMQVQTAQSVSSLVQNADS